MNEENNKKIIDNAKVMTQEQKLEMAKELGIEIVPEKKIHGNTGKKKSDEWKQKHKEAMKAVWAKKKAQN